MRIHVIVVSLAAALAGCVSPNPLPPTDPGRPKPTLPECRPVPPAPAPVSPLLAWQAYQFAVSNLGKTSLTEHLAEAEKHYNEHPTADVAMRLGITLAAFNTPPRQERAQRLFNNLRIDPRLKAEEQQFAALQALHLNELRLLRQEKSRLEQRLDQETRAKQALDDKIKALTNIELRINERQRNEKPIELPGEAAKVPPTDKPTVSAPATTAPEKNSTQKPSGPSASPAQAVDTKPSPPTEKPIATPPAVSPAPQSQKPENGSEAPKTTAPKPMSPEATAPTVVTGSKPADAKDSSSNPQPKPENQLQPSDTPPVKP